ncbi:glycine zipper 2TM domain-containing protein [Microcystis aeruginosa 11-30S32]|uniref:Glycine zipper 2TM domain-containing protein n=2 Tax=Microcystis aeruginosa TaxID=1126 RepID=A0A510PN27_MICAE|nr:glycine zipper 2TM domain-containing protein [Microcystis aeruginosa 11-30S32]
MLKRVASISKRGGLIVGILAKWGGLIVGILAKWGGLIVGILLVPSTIYLLKLNYDISNQILKYQPTSVNPPFTDKEVEALIANIKVLIAQIKIDMKTGDENRTLELIFKLILQLARLLVISQQDNQLQPDFTVHFEFNEAQVTPAGRVKIGRAIQFADQNKSKMVFIYCYADRVGKESFNFSLSEKRCNAVIDILVDEKISRDRIKPCPLGEYKHHSHTDDEIREPENRLAEIEITNEQKDCPKPK